MSGSTPGSYPERNPSPIDRPSGRFDILKNKFVKDTAWLEVGMFVTAGTYVFTSMLLARSLGPADLGRFDLAQRFYDFCYFIANLGLINATVVRYSHATGRKDKEAQVLSLAAFLKIYLIMATAIVTLGFFVCPFAGEKIYGDRIVGTYGWALCVMGFIDLMRAMTVALLQGARHMHQVARYESAIAMTRVLVLTLAVVGGYGLPGIIIGTIIAYSLSSIMGFRYYHLLRLAEGPESPPGLLEVIRALPRARMKDFFSLGFMIAINKNLMVLLQIFSTFFMATVSFMSTGHLRIAWILTWGLTLLLGGVSRSLLPTLGFRLGDAGDKDISRMGRSLFKVSMASGILFIVLTGAFLLILPWVVRIVYGAAYKESVGIVLILSSSHLVLGFAVILDAFYIYADRIKTQIIINTIIFATVIPLGYFLTRYGATGVASYLAVARFMVLIHFVYIIFYFRKARREDPDRQ